MLKLSCDSKVWMYKGQKNSFGLLPGPEHTCPYATVGEGGCWSTVGDKKVLRECYAQKISVLRYSVNAVLKHNTDELKNSNNKKLLLTDMFGEFKDAQVKWAKRNNSDVKDILYFRLHWSGDVYSEEYAKALVDAMGQYPDINFWGYTRSFKYISKLIRAKNCIWYLSLDKQNKEIGLQCFNKHIHDTRICYMSHTNDLDKDVKLVACPADTKKIDKIGSCAKCKLCRIPKETNIWFKLS